MLSPMMRRLSSQTVLFSVSLSVAACTGGAGSGRSTTALSIDLPETIQAADAPELLRAYHGLSLDDPTRRVLRTRLLAFYARTAGDLDIVELDVVAERLEAMTDLFLPAELSDGDELAPLEPIARALVRRGNPRGDEARVLSGLMVLRGRGQSRARSEYRLVAEWGREARSHLPTGMQRYTELIDVWERHASLTPAPSVLDTLARLHVKRRDSVMQAVQDGPQMLLQLGSLPTQVRRVAPLDVAGVYLRVGDLDSARERVRAMGADGETESQLLAVLQKAEDGDDEEAAEALIELAEAYREVKPLVARGVCRLGLRRFPSDPRFPTCLARVAAANSDVDDATAWYAQAIDLAPGLRPLYDEALTQLDDLLEHGTLTRDADAARHLAARAERLLDERQRRWPATPAPIARGRIELLVGAAEMQAGNADEAQRRLEASVADRETSGALVQLGTLEQRRGQHDAATRHFRRALDLANNPIQRAEILEHLGEAFGDAGNADQSERMYRQALQIWDRTATELGSQEEARLLMARLQVRRGVLLDRLGERTTALQAFRSALAAGPAFTKPMPGFWRIWSLRSRTWNSPKRFFVCPSASCHFSRSGRYTSPCG